MHNDSPALRLASDILLTKLHIPTPRANLVTRPRLVGQLVQVLTHPLTLISAPPGFGKSTLLAAWIAGLTASAAWVSLDPADNDPIRFLTYAVVALDSIFAGLAETVLPLLHAPKPPLEPILTLLVNTFVKAPKPVVLVLDDYHVIDSKTIHDGLGFLLAHLPPPMHLVISSRQDPPFALAQLRAREQLLELRAADLRFTLDEAAAFLNSRMGLNLGAHDVAILEERTEGWIAGLQLAALSMQGHQDRAKFIPAFQGSHRYIADYLAEQVLARQTPRVQNFLLETSILEQMNGALCNVVTAQNDSEIILRQLDQANLFLIPLDDDRQWYRYHHLFADVLRVRLTQLGSTRVSTLHRRASEWFAQNDLIIEAISHALAARDYAYAAVLIQENTDVYLRRVPHDMLQTWIEQLPSDLVRTRPRLVLARAWASLLKHQLEDAEVSLADAEAALVAQIDPPPQEELRGELLAVRALIAAEREQWARGIELTEQALARLPGTRVRLRAELLMRLGQMYSWLSQAASALRAFRQAETLSLASNDVSSALFALFNQGGLGFWQGHIELALTAHRRALELAQQRGLTLLPILAFIHFDLGEIYYYRNDLETAGHHLAEALALAQETRQPRAQALTLSYLARLKHARGDTTGALEILEQAEQIVSSRKLPARYASRVAAIHAEMWLNTGDLNRAVTCMETTGYNMNDTPAFLLTPMHQALIQIAAARSQVREALTFLTRVLQMSEEGGWRIHTVELLVLEADILSAHGETARAQKSLERASALAAPLGLLRVFLDRGEPIRLLLLDYRMSGAKRATTENYQQAQPHLAFIDRVLAAFAPAALTGTPGAASRKPQGETGFESLSERELQVLRLIADGLSNQEVARKLYLSVGTVKVHLKHIYSKLDVSTRTQATARARALNLL